MLNGSIATHGRSHQYTPLLHLCRTERVSMDIGDRHGRLEVLSDPFKEGKCQKVRVRCNCGKEKVVIVDKLQRGHTQSCGCLNRERTSQANTTHGMSKSCLYRVWRAMVGRCTNPSDKTYHQYGGRRITVCDEWRSFEAFQLWAESAGYADHLTLDRRDNNGGYCPKNCRFVTQGVQVENRRKQSNNTSGYIGVSVAKDSGLYRAGASRNNRTIHLGYFSDPIEAAKVRDAFVSKHYDSPTLNF